MTVDSSGDADELSRYLLTRVHHVDGYALRMRIRRERVLYQCVGSTDEVGTYRFAFNGVPYEIDLPRPNFDRMAAAFQPFIARRLPKPAAKNQARQAPDRRAVNARVRQWWTTHWQEHGLPEPRTRGAIPPAVRDAYTAAH